MHRHFPFGCDPRAHGRERGVRGFGRGDRGHDFHRGHRRGGGRFFEQGDLRLVILSLIAEAPSHGYQVIRTIEERTGDEVSYVQGKTETGEIARVRVSPEASPAGNPAFDVTPARLVTGLITERGVLAANRDALAKAFPERAS